MGFNRMADELQDLYATLEQRIEDKTRSIEAKNKELAMLDREMLISEQRNILAQELHDSIAQSLAFLNIQVQLLQEDFKHARHVDIEKGLLKIREGVQDSYDDVRALLVHFRTRIVATDLVSAITAALEKFEGQTGIKTTFELSGTMPVLPAEAVLQLMHIVQEALSNARKHAQATLISVELMGDEQSQEPCQLFIRDNGVGFDLNRDLGDSHVGLRIMRERAHRIGAQLMIESELTRGSCIHLVVAK
jgi:two-component system nitrate/nitrite sensor histidine kinase NarX